MKHPIFTVILVGAVMLSSGCRKDSPTGAKAPVEPKMLWPAPEDVTARLQVAGLPNLVEHGEDPSYHIHTHLEVYKDGEQVLVPRHVGIATGILAPVHTHLATGVIHVETPNDMNITLGHFFKLWNVPLEGARVVVDDVEVPNPETYKLEDQDLITVYYGK